MEPAKTHKHQPNRSFDGGDLDCGNGLLLLIRRHIDPMEKGELLEIRSTEVSVDEELPAWCRLTSNELVSWTREGQQRSFLVCKGSFSGVPGHSKVPAETPNGFEALVRDIHIPDQLPAPIDSPPVSPFSVMGVGSWPRPRWMVQAIHEHISGRLGEDEFQSTADDAVRLCVKSQEQSGVDVVTDGEQRRDSYASFVGGLLDNAQLIPLTDLLSMVDDPEKFQEELRALDVPAGEVRHPVAFGRLGRSHPLALHEYQFLKTQTDKPAKVALPGPYLLTRTMWLDCLKERAYESREDLARDIVRVLREELHFLLASGAAIVQFDEPVLTEVVFTGATAKRSFMCGALSEKGDPKTELAFALELMNSLVDGVEKERTALHVCRGNWTRDESALLQGDYRSLRDFLRNVEVGTLFLEFSTPRAGEIEVLGDLPHRIGLGVVNPRSDRIEEVEEIEALVNKAVGVFGPERLLINSDCGFATFADNPVATKSIAEGKLAAMSKASKRLKARYFL